MKAEELLARLDGVRRGARGWIARCPGHDDRHPSLAINEGHSGVLVKCWAGCTLIEIAGALGLAASDFFYDNAAKGSSLTMQLRHRESGRRRREAARRRVGRLLDARREAEYFITSLHNIEISGLSPSKLNRTLNRAADAYAILEGDPLWPMNQEMRLLRPNKP
ncbi:MAG: hypothetical protein H0X01_10180 [Nitrospira sp.]|nr:hypothetical protein [Nitrospira sp.]